MLGTELANKLKILQDILAGFNGVLVAYSGGVDSSLLLKVASTAADRVLAVTASSPIRLAAEKEAAQKLAEELGVEHVVITTAEMADPDFIANSARRCYFCKKALFHTLQELAKEHKLEVVIDGSNADDSNDYRPGSLAARECGVRSPLQEAGINKSEVRQLARHLGLPNWDKPALACLASRIPYGQAITREKIEQVAAAEAYLKQMGLKTVRVRHHDTIARLEVDPDAFALLTEAGNRRRLIDYLHGLGFIYITLDLEGFRSGSMNAVLPGLG
ncbi:MAG: ATP-dependent sacrificial sulfur transferase LarE [Clostridia bacterium]|nr:ATP-dependent sacrificial sulfur transferase LarE [Clostridia bacterium]